MAWITSRRQAASSSRCCEDGELGLLEYLTEASSKTLQKAAQKSVTGMSACDADG